MAATGISAEQGIRLSSLSPKYLHTNSTSHTWPFSAIAELIDNAYDPDVDASQLWIDVKKYRGQLCLTFTDNGAGMNADKLHKMLSFGFCEKVEKKGHMPVGHYGNGFKSGSMRLGKDALVFTKDGKTKSVGFLSQTYLEAIKAETVLVPIITWDSLGKMVKKSDGDKALQDMLRYSVFKTEDDLKFQFDLINEGDENTGTRIIISNIRQTLDGKTLTEFDIKSDPSDIKIPDDAKEEERKYKRQERQNHIPESDYSLRAYCSILYLKPKMQIILRGKKVKTVAIAKSLSKTEVDYYRPSTLPNKAAVKIVFGFSQNKNHYGIMMYHRNRLIKPYVRVGYQLRANNQGVGVIGVIQCDFLQPTHNKQDFDYTKTFRACMSSLGTKLNEYWNEKKGIQRNNTVLIPEPQEVQALPDQTWVQCDNPHCLKWRKLPHGTEPDSLPDKWYCKLNPDPAFRSCDVPEEKDETEPEETVQPYVKTQKKRLEKELEEKKRREKESKLLAEKKQQEEAKKLELKKQELQKKEEELNRLKKQMEEQVKTNEAAILKAIQTKSRKQIENAQQKAQVKPEPSPSPVKLQVKVVPMPLSAGKRPSGPVQAPVKQTTPQIVPKFVSVTPGVVSKQKTSAVPPPKYVIINSAASTQVAKTLPSTAVVRPGNQQLVVKQSVPMQSASLPTPLSGGTMKMVSVMPQQVAAVAPKVVSVSSVTNSVPVGLPTQVGQVKGAVTPQIAQVQTQQPNLTGQKVIHIKLPNPPPKQVTSQPVTTAVKHISNPSPAVGKILLPSTKTPTQPLTVTQPATPAVYKPLESLKEVKRHAESSISPMSALISDDSQSQVSELGRQKVTVNERYRYIAPSAQAVQNATVTKVVSGSAVQIINVPSSTVVATTQLQTQPQIVAQSATALQQSSQTSQAKASQETKPVVNAANVSPQIQISQVHSGVTSVTAATADSSSAKLEVKTEPPDNSSARIQGGNALKRSSSASDTSEQPPAQRIKLEPKTSGYKDDDDEDCVIIDPPPTKKSPPEIITVNGEKQPDEEKDKQIERSIENLSLVAKFSGLSAQEQFDELVEAKSQLRDLRANVCKLLAVLVPELDLGDTEQKNFLDDCTVDELLKQVLDANTQSEATEPEK